MFNQETLVTELPNQPSNDKVAYRMPYELFNDQLGQTMYEISRMPLVDGLLMGGKVSLAKTLVKRCGYSLRTARRHIKRLEQSGLLVSSKTLSSAGLQGINLYRRLFD